MTNPLLAQFVAEAGDLLAEVDEGLLRLEADPHDADLVNAVFRAAHTFKGSSGLFDLPDLTRLTHAAEDLLDSVRSGALALDGDMVDDLLAAFDAVRSWIPSIESTGSAPAGAAEQGAALARRLRVPLGGEAEGSGGSASSAAGGDSTTSGEVPRDLPAWVGDLPHEPLADLAVWLQQSGATLRAVDYRPDPDCFFRGEDPVNLVRQLPALEQLLISTGSSAPTPTGLPPIADLDEYQCLLRFTALTRAATAEVRYVFRYVPDQVEVVEVGAQALLRLLAGETAQPDPGGAAGAPEEHASDEAERLAPLLPVIESQVRLLRLSEPTPATLTSAVTAVARVLEAVGTDPLPLVAVLAASLDGESAGVLAWIEGYLGAVRPADTSAPVPAAPPAAIPAPRTPSEAAHPEEPASTGARVLKVEQGKVDRLLDLVGELVVAKNSLPYVADDAEAQGHRALARRIKDEYAVVSRVSEELQQAVMDVRMLPMATAFARVPRLVRDLSRKLGKQVRLVQEGEDVAADKDVIEMLAEPLVHLVRNSLDHGIETPAARESAGKPGEATLVLRAAQDGDAVVVEVVDDGAGVNTDAVRRKAYERGIIDEQALESLSDAEAAELIFAPGFSTAERISDVSGRGVGMDAVRSSIERLGGSVGVDSRPGVGLTVRLRLPLSMAVSRVLLITAGGQRFGVPLDEVVETVRVPRSSLTRVAGHQVLVLREDVVPLVQLTELLDLAEEGGDASEVSILVVRTPTGPLGVVVDRFHQNTDVILKPLEGLLAGTPSYCGTALLGDGLVLLVLDVKELNTSAAAAQ